MIATFTPLMDQLQIRNWPSEENKRLFDEINDDLAMSGSHPRISQELADELEREVDAHDAEPSSAIPWSEASKIILAGLHQP